MKTYYIVIGYTESADIIGPYLFDHYPSKKEMNTIFERDIPEEVESDTISSWRVHEVNIEK